MKPWTKDELEEFDWARRKVDDNPMAVHRLYVAQNLDLTRIGDYRRLGVGCSSTQYRRGLIRSIRARRVLAEEVGIEGMP